MTDKWQEVDRWFRAAQDREPDRRVQFLQDSCLDPAVRAEVLEMLATDSTSRTPPADLPTSLRADIVRLRAQVQQCTPAPPDTSWIESVFLDSETGQERWEILDVKERPISLVYPGVDRSTERPFAPKTYRDSVFRASIRREQHIRQREARRRGPVPSEPARFHYTRAADGTIEDLNGEAPGHRLPAERLAAPAALELCGAIAAIVATAESDGVVHADLEASDIRINGAEVSINGFGEVGDGMETHPPEGQSNLFVPPGPRVDWIARQRYSLGYVIFQVLAGRALEVPRAPAADHDAAVARALAEIEPIAVRDLLAKLLAWRPARRPSAREARAVLAAIVGPCSGTTRATRSLEDPRPPHRRYARHSRQVQEVRAPRAALLRSQRRYGGALRAGLLLVGTGEEDATRRRRDRARCYRGCDRVVGPIIAPGRPGPGSVVSVICGSPSGPGCFSSASARRRLDSSTYDIEIYASASERSIRVWVFVRVVVVEGCPRWRRG